VDVFIAWVAVSILVAGAVAACTRNRRRRIALLFVVPAVLIGVPVAAFYAAAHQLSIPAFAVISLAAAAASAAIAPNTGTRIAALLIVPPVGVALALILHGMLVACCAS
jgi:hypothetical protein